MKNIKSWQKFENWDPYETHEPDLSWEEENIKHFTGYYKELEDVIDTLIEEEQTYFNNKPNKPEKKKEEETHAYYFGQVLDKNVNQFFPNKNKIGVYGSDTREYYFLNKYITKMYPNSWTKSNDDELIYYEIHKVNTPMLKIMTIVSEEFLCQDCASERYHDSEWDHISLNYLLVEDDKLFTKHYKFIRQFPEYIIDLLYKKQLKEETSKSLYWINRVLRTQNITKQQIDLIVKMYQQLDISEETSKLLARILDNDLTSFVDLFSDEEISSMSSEKFKKVVTQLKMF